MDTTILKFKASRQDLVKTGGVREIASHTIRYVKAEFDLNDVWNEVQEVKAIWVMKGEIYPTVIQDGCCFVPSELLDSIGKVEMNLQGTIHENGILKFRMTTFPIVALTVTRKAEVGSN